jgi:hypothetical protein
MTDRPTGRVVVVAARLALRAVTDVVGEVRGGSVSSGLLGTYSMLGIGRWLNAFFWKGMHMLHARKNKIKYEVVLVQTDQTRPGQTGRQGGRQQAGRPSMLAAFWFW